MARIAEYTNMGFRVEIGMLTAKNGRINAKMVLEP